MILTLLASIMYWSLNQKGRVKPSSEENNSLSRSASVMSEDGDYDNNLIDDASGEKHESENPLLADAEGTALTYT